MLVPVFVYFINDKTYSLQKGIVAFRLQLLICSQKKDKYPLLCLGLDNTFLFLKKYVLPFQSFA